MLLPGLGAQVIEEPVRTNTPPALEIQPRDASGWLRLRGDYY